MAERAVAYAADQRGQRARADRALGDRLALGVEPARELAHQPVRDQLWRAAAVTRGFVEARESQALRHHRSVVHGQAVLLLEAQRHRRRQLGQGGANRFDPVGRDHQRRQVGVGEVAVVVRVFLAAHGPGLAGVRVEQHRGLADRQAVFDLVDLPVDLEVDRLRHVAERVQVLDLAPGAQRRAGAPHRNVGVASEAAFLHVAVADPQPHHQHMQGAGVLHSLCRRSHVRLGDDLEQRRAGAVQVDAAARTTIVAVVVVMQALAGVLFKVGPGQPNRPGLAGQHEADAATLDHRRLVLADLVALGQVGVEVVLAREDRHRCHFRTHRQPEPDREFDGGTVHHRQRARQGQIDRTGLGVGLGAECRRCAGENLAAGRQLRMGLQADDDLVATDQWGAVHVEGGA